MIRDYLHYRSKGLRPFKSFLMAWPRRTSFEIFTALLALLTFVWLVMLGVLQDINSRHLQLVLSAHAAKFERNVQADKVERMEAVLIRCLQQQSITVNGRSMNCSIQEHREAVDI